jgi:hypothetical protein
VNLPDAETRAFEPVAEVRTVLAHEIAGRRDQTNVSSAAERLGDRDAEHDLGLAGAGRGLEEKFEFSGCDQARDRLDRGRLIGGEGKRFAGCDQLVSERDRVFVDVDAVPDGPGRLV